MIVRYGFDVAIPFGVFGAHKLNWPVRVPPVLNVPRRAAQLGWLSRQPATTTECLIPSANQTNDARPFISTTGATANDHANDSHYHRSW